MTTTLVLTTAPSAYDYEYVVELATDLTVEQYDGQRNPPSNVRLVSMPSERVDYQTGRYMSGMYFTTVRTPHDCGVCDGPLEFDGMEGNHLTYVCPTCKAWHYDTDCCELTRSQS